ncbi:AMP-binding protein [Amycolatopsis sp. lyj-108]|uniref:AMP-binding protein n=1 Tax=Amycolatopsis sp. lyj-108 TaxID=2789286 RepID=UPI00397C6C89
MSESLLDRLATDRARSDRHITFTRFGGSESLDLSRLQELAGHVAGGLAELGVVRGDRIGIHGSNSLEWVLLDLAALRLGVVTAGLEPEKFRVDPALLSRYSLRLLFTDTPVDAPGVHDMAEVRRWMDAGTTPSPVSHRPGDVTTIKFTSGSTGEPKGLAATVGSIESSLRAVQQLFSHGPDDHLFVFLPLSLLQQRYWIYSALLHGHDVTISTHNAAFATLRRAAPSVVMGIPAFYEVMRRRIESLAARISPADPAAALPIAAQRFFGPRIRYLWTGSAPAGPATLRFFSDVGLPIFEGYGLNETCIVTKNHPGAWRIGSVGKVVPGKEVLIDAEGVISVRGDHPVNTRYEYGPPGASEEVFGTDGTVRTGDLGYFDGDGFLYIRGRADDVIVLDNARKIVVRPIEERLRECPAVDECVIFCPSRTYLVAVVSAVGRPPDLDAITDWVTRTNATVERDERIAKIVLARERFSVANGQLTAQLKPRRAAILAAHENEVNDRTGVTRAP